MDKTPTKSYAKDRLRYHWSLAREIHRATDPQQALDRALARLHELEDVDGAWAWCRGPECSELMLKLQRGLTGNVADALSRIPATCRLGGRIAMGQDTVDDWEAAWDDLAGPLLEAGWTDVAAWPMVVGSDVAGALCVGRRGGVVTEASREIAEIIAEELSGCIARKREATGQSVCRRSLSTLFDAFDDFVFVVDGRGTVLQQNAATADGLGHSENKLVGQSIDRVVPGATVMLRQAQQQLSEGHGQESAIVNEGYVLSAESHLVPIEIRIMSGGWEDQNVWFLVCRDVTHQNGVEQERERLFTAIEQAAESFIITDSSGTIQYVNSAFTTMTGWEKDEAIGANPRFLKSGQQSSEFYRQLWDTITQGSTWTGKIVNRRRDGSLFTEEATISPVRDENGIITHFVAVKRDVTHEVELEERLRQSQKMEAIGTLAGGIAHDFNNILYALLGYSQLALDDIPADHPARQSIEEIELAGQRASKLVAKMLTFSRRAESGREVLQLQSVVTEALELARASLPATISFEVSLDEDCPPVKADETQMLQVLLNLCANAEHAMRSYRGGVLDVRLSSRQVAATGSQDLPAGTWVCLEIGDTGHGIDETVVERVFEPYFTTKKSNEGTGLGLATVHGIITDHGGRIRVDSEPGEGTRFTIFLPSAELPAVPAPHPADHQTEEAESGGASAKVAIVDDEAMIVDVVTRALSRLGYEVSGFQDGVKALEAFRADPSCFDVVITDQTMPNITGFELAAQLHQIRADLPIILTTGYANLAEDEELDAVGIACFLPKPLRIGSLAEAVDDLVSVPVTS